MSSTSSLSSSRTSDDPIHISPRQQPVITRLHDTIALARAYADAIRDNAQEEHLAIPPELVSSFAADCDAITASLHTAATL